MDATSLGRIEGELKAIRKSIEALSERMRARTLEATTLSVPQAAKRLGKSLSLMRRLIAANEVLTVRIGKREAVPISELERLTTPLPPHQKAAQMKARARWVPIPKRR